MNSNNQYQSSWSDLENHLTAFVSKKVKDSHATKDIIQDVFVKFHTNIGSLKDEKKVNSWIFQITRNTINDYFRNHQKTTQEFTFTEKETPSLEKDEHQELSKCMVPMIGLLPDKYRQAVFLSDIKGLSQKELAKQLNISYSGAKSRVQRGRQKLKSIFLECCKITTDKYGTVIDYKKRICEEGC